MTSHGVKFHQYADDTQVYTAVESLNYAEDITRLESCCVSIRDWFASNGMQLNPDKSEVLLMALKSVAKNLTHINKVNIAGFEITAQPKLKSLGVTLDTSLTINQHVQDIAKSCNYHIIEAFRHIHSYLEVSVVNMVACSIVTSCLDYCNLLLYNTSQANLTKLQ